MKKVLLFIIIITALILLLRAWDDEAIFTSVNLRLKPNIVVLMDNSGSMNNVVFYPKFGVDGIPAGQPGDTDGSGFDPKTTYSGTVSNASVINQSDGTSWVGNLFYREIPGWFGFVRVNTESTKRAYFPDGINGTIIEIVSSTRIRVDQNTYNLFYNSGTFRAGWVQGASSQAYASVTGVYHDHPGGLTYYYLDIADQVDTFTVGETLNRYRTRTDGVFHPIHLYGGDDLGYHAYYDSNYMKWVTIYATQVQLDSISHFHQYAITDKKPGVPDELDYNPFDTSYTPSAAKTSYCECAGQARVMKIFTRIQVAREVACKMANDNYTKIYLGLYFFAANSEGAVVLDTPKDMSEGNNLQQYKNKIWDKMANTNTPLAESLADIWRDFKPGPVGGKNYWPVTAYHPPTTSYMKKYCQNNYCIIVTDGQSLDDDLQGSKYAGSVFRSKPVNRTQAPVWQDGIPTYTWNYNHGWGDYHPTGDPALSSYDSIPAPSTNNNRPYCPYNTCWSSGGSDWLDDMAYFLYAQDMFPDNLYGTSPVSGWPGDQNIKTYTIGFNAENDMLNRAAKNGGGQYYTSSNFNDLSAAIQSAIDNIQVKEEEMMFTSFAAPKQSFTFGKRGYVATFVPRNNKTIWEGHLQAYQLDDNGDFPVDMTAVWDSYTQLKNTATNDRKLYTVKGGALVEFTTANITAQDLAVFNAADDDPSNPSDPNEVRRDTVVNFIRGDNGYEYKLGDIFHFNPLVVGAPLRWKAAFDDSYKTFYETYQGRTEVIYVGTNDGMLHCIKVETGDELWGFIPASQLKRLKNLTSVVNAIDRPQYYRYFVDGKGMTKDVQISGNWRTVMIFGMGIGGKSYCALDVTNPTSAGPGFLWEFTDAVMGHTEARPVIADFLTSSSTGFTGVALAGGYNLAEAPVPDLEGKSLYICRIQPDSSGNVLFKKFVYGTPGGDSFDGGVYTHIDPNIQYAITASPALADTNNDGYADVIYAAESGDYRTGETGGRMWHISVSGEPMSWGGNVIYQANNSQTIYFAPTLGYDDDYNLWVMFGTGRRPKIAAWDADHNFINPTGQFIAFIDNGSIAFPLNNATNLHEITSLFTGGTDNSFTIADPIKGIYFNFINESNEIFYEPTPLYINGEVILNTFSPEKASEEVPEEETCSEEAVTGSHFIYRFTLSSQGGTISIPAAATAPGKILGYGLLSGGKYKIYTGSSTPGGFTIQRSDTLIMDDIFGPMSWKENKK